MTRLQSVQNAAAHLELTDTRRCDHITPVLRLLQWLRSTQYASASTSRLPHLFIGRCPEILRHTQVMTVVLSPTLVSDDYAPERAGHASLPGPMHSTFADRAFATAGPGLWNSLPPHLRDAVADLPYSRFRRSTKRHFCLDSAWGHGAVRTILTAPSRNNVTYLLTYLFTIAQMSP